MRRSCALRFLLNERVFRTRLAQCWRNVLFNRSIWAVSPESLPTGCSRFEGKTFAELFQKSLESRARFRSSGGSDGHIARHVSSDRSPNASPTIRRVCRSNAGQIQTLWSFEPTYDQRSSNSRMGRSRNGVMVSASGGITFF